MLMVTVNLIIQNYQLLHSDNTKVCVNWRQGLSVSEEEMECVCVCLCFNTFEQRIRGEACSERNNVFTYGCQNVFC